LIKNQSFARKVLPFLKTEYFNTKSEEIAFSVIRDYMIKYNRPPTYESLVIFITNLESKQQDKDDAIALAAVIDKDTFEQQEDWLIDVTEKFCQEKALYLGMKKSLEIMDGSNRDKLTTGAIPQILQDALAVTFDPHVGHDYFEEFEQRYEYYHKVDARIPFDLEMLNTITNGGVPDKTLNVLVGGVNVGKSLILCHLAASYLSAGYDVLYITLEMAEEEISKRIDANLLNIPMDDLMQLPHDLYTKKVNVIKSKTTGKLIVKEFPTAAASTLHFKALLNELYLKKTFKPKILIIDYINICASSRMKMGGSVNSYLYIKAIAEELRGLAVEMGLRIWTATQLTRSGFGNSDPDMTDVAESFGLPATADFMIVVITNDDLEKLGQYMIKQVKNRYNSKTKNKSFVVGVDYTRMRIFDAEQKSQVNIQGNQPVVNTNKFSGIRV